MAFNDSSKQCAWRTPSFFLAALAVLISPLAAAQSGYSQPAPVQPNLESPVTKTEGPKENIRPVIAKPMFAAEKLLAEKKYQEVLEQIAEAEKVGDRTAFENYMLDRMRATAALGVGNDALAVRSLESALASGRIPPADTLNFVDGVARIHYRQKDYRQAAIWAARAVKDPGVRIETRLLLGHASYLIGDFPTAKTEIAAVLAAAEQAGKPMPEDQLRLLASATQKSDDNEGYVAVLEKLAVRYPKKDYWADLIHRVESRQGFAERLALDAFRLKLATSAMSGKGDFMEMAALSLQSGYPAEAQKVIDAGIAAGVLARDAAVDSEKQLRVSISKELAEEIARSAKAGTTTPKGSLALLNNGFDAVLKGDARKGLEMMEAGMKAGDLRRPEDARLRYGIALVMAGQRPKASETFKAVQGTDGTAELAHLWDLYSRQAGS
ncbi:MAG: hypothetical protein ABI790_07515 [Betaproteobacteria bacterium]